LAPRLLPFALGYALSYLIRSASAPLADPMAKDLGLSPGGLGVVIPFYAESLVLGHQWKRVCRLRVSGAFSRTRHRSATTSIISSRS
jgi:hypothetical protein